MPHSLLSSLVHSLLSVIIGIFAQCHDVLFSDFVYRYVQSLLLVPCYHYITVIGNWSYVVREMNTHICTVCSWPQIQAVGYLGIHAYIYIIIYIYIVCGMREV